MHRNNTRCAMVRFPSRLAASALVAAVGLVAVFAATPAPAISFTSLDGTELRLEDWRGQPVLVVNTASLCGFTRQYADLQTLHERYGPRGLVVLAVPSDDFRQELGSDAEVAEFCEVNFGLTIPITRITPVLGAGAHPFYRWLAEEHGVRPAWNFNKALIGPDGALRGFWGSGTRPTARAITRAIESALRG